MLSKDVGTARSVMHVGALDITLLKGDLFPTGRPDLHRTNVRVEFERSERVAALGWLQRGPLGLGLALLNSLA